MPYAKIQSPPTIAVALAAFNRRETTLRSLETLHAQTGVGLDWTLRIHLLDDSSTDGTAEAVAERFPSVVLLNGNGNLFWGGSMAKAMASALAQPADFLLMLNDDVELAPDAVDMALAEYAAACKIAGNSMQVVIGSVSDPATGAMSYSGFRRTHRRDPSKISRVAPSPAALTPCDTMNGNFVLIPKAITDQLGTVDPLFVHQLGDIDYGYRVVRAGGGLWIARKPVGTCAPNNRVMPFRKPGLSVMARWRAMNHPLGLPLRPWFAFMWRWGGIEGLARLATIYALRLAGH